ncbi:uncharacterized protein F5147DRAFT_658678 [Suillus discolor]|uniref:Fungal-type protein kinase domain-containing protein n=1 Tax=Suillus discolor TaxID=1912936 RepID=A0A9P7ETK7_9AGAM|nr:uncharacterized protein F5147DRAFT_658678 [Suillus discolor]KAG2088560.1 hypothetical protein F5147DRAFT_658678 [Suillus discolor]
MSADSTDSTPPARIRTPELLPQTPTRSTAQDLQPGLLVDDTPVKRSCSTMQPYTTNTRCRDTTLNAMGNEIRGHLVGPMPVEQFLEEFLPPSTIPDYQPLTSFSDGAFESTLSAAHETKAYEPFINTMTSFAPGLSFIDTHSNADTTNCKLFPFHVKPDICVYANESPPPRAGQPPCDISATEVVIEFKWEPHHNPFYTPANGPGPTSHFISETDKAMDTLGQITSYAAAQLGAQYRTHAFMVLIIFDQAYILRWDREGTTVSSAIHYNEEPHLADFFHRYGQASPALRGVDTSVTPASAEEARLARLQLGLPATKRMLKTTVPGVDNSDSITLVFPAPLPVGQTPIGRCTRACPAYDLGNKKVVMLKDSWRVAIADVLPEGETYKLLKKHNVSNIASCIACHDVPSIPQQAPQTYKFADAPWACSHDTITPHIHYRLVLNIVGKQLCEFESSHQFVAAIRDALIAHKDAYNSAGVLHRDLSAGNVVIHKGKGILIDWDLSKLISIKGARQVTRTGTWQFMSAHLVQNRDARHDVEDDLESSLYVVLWIALMYTETHLTPPVRSLLVKDVFEVNELEGVGSTSKSAFLNSRIQFSKDVFVDRKPLDSLVLALAELFAIRYTLVAREEQKAYVTLCEYIEGLSPDAAELASLINLSKAHPCYRLKMNMEALRSHEKIIEVYDLHLGLDGWVKDPPVAQTITSYDNHHVKRRTFTKSQCGSWVELTTSSKRRRVEG